MEEVFQNYKHYGDWILRKWRTDRVLDALIVKNELMIKREISCNGEPYRPLTEEEFNERNSQSFIKIPTIYESDGYQDGHRLAE